MDGLAEVRREQGRRLVIVSQLRERDLGSFVEEARRMSRRRSNCPLQPSTSKCQYQNLQAAQERLQIVIPIAFAVILLLLYMVPEAGFPLWLFS